jgi:hypothetical protein
MKGMEMSVTYGVETEVGGPGVLGLLRDGLLRDGLLRDGLLRDGLVRDGQQFVAVIALPGSALRPGHGSQKGFVYGKVRTNSPITKTMRSP